MDVVYRCCAWIDVHKERVLVNLRRKGAEGRANLEEVRTHATMTGDLLDLCEWLQSEGCTHIPMESTEYKEASLQYPGRKLLGDPGERQAHDRRGGLPVDCPASAREIGNLYIG